MTFAVAGQLHQVAAVRLKRVELARYGVFHAIALACDWSLLVGLVAVGTRYLVAATLSFVVGTALARAVALSVVFKPHRRATREAEVAAAFSIGIVGLVLTLVLLYILVSRFGFPVAMAKAPTAAVVLVFDLCCRRRLVVRDMPHP